MPELLGKNITDKQEWEMLLDKFPHANFLQSWNWKLFQESLHKKTHAQAFFHHEECVGVCLFIKEEAKRGAYLTAAGGPLLQNWESREILTELFSHIKELATQEHCSFVRFRPQIVQTQQALQLIEDLGCKKAPMHLTADLTLQLDLSLTEDELLSQMRKSTRYEIRKSTKDGVRVETSQDPEEIQAFYAHQLELAKKHRFVPFSYAFLHQQFVIFAQENQAMLFHAYKDNNLLASAFIIFYRNEAVYHYGISTPENRLAPGAHAIQWAAILEAKKRGIKFYNFWGIAPEEQKQHRFASVSLFKRGFGGQEVQYVQAHDLPVSFLYWTTYLFELLRKKLRRL